MLNKNKREFEILFRLELLLIKRKNLLRFIIGAVIIYAFSLNFSMRSSMQKYRFEPLKSY